MRARANKPRAASLEVVDDPAFQCRVLDNTRPVLVLFPAATCPPCKMLERRLPDLAREFQDGVDILVCPIETSPSAAHEYRITQTPTLALFDGGVVIASHAGLWSIPAIRSWVHASLREKGKSPHTEGADTHEGGSSMFSSRAFWHSFFSRAVALQACRVASVVAPALLLVNHSDLVLRDPFSVAVGTRLALNFVVPYLVSSYSAARTAVMKPAAAGKVS